MENFYHHCQQQHILSISSYKTIPNGSGETAFQTLKQQLLSKPVLAHYDSSLPLKLMCDASPYGVGAVIFHVMPNGDEKPIAFGSRTLSRAERNYAQVEKEALAIVFGIKFFINMFMAGSSC